MTKKILTFSFLIIVSLTSFGQMDKAYTRTLNKLFDVSGSEEAYQTVIQQFVIMFKEQYTEVDPEIWDELEKEFSKTSMKELTEMLVPVYSKYMSIEDLKELIKFYESPIGQKFAKNSPLIMQESMQIGKEWGMKIGQEIDEKMKNKLDLSVPSANIKPHVHDIHGDKRQDNYFWLRDDKREDPEVLAYLEEENRYTEQMMAPLSGISAPGRPARRRCRCAPAGALLSCEQAHSRDTATGDTLR